MSKFSSGVKGIATSMINILCCIENLSSEKRASLGYYEYGFPFNCSLDEAVSKFNAAFNIFIIDETPADSDIRDSLNKEFILSNIRDMVSAFETLSESEKAIKSFTANMPDIFEFRTFFEIEESVKNWLKLYEVNNEERKCNISDKQREELCEIYNESDIAAIEYMEKLLEDSNDIVMKTMIKRVKKLSSSTVMGFAAEELSLKELGEYYNNKWKLLRYFGISDNLGNAYIKK